MVPEAQPRVRRQGDRGSCANKGRILRTAVQFSDSLGGDSGEHCPQHRDGEITDLCEVAQNGRMKEGQSGQGIWSTATTRLKTRQTIDGS